MAAKRSYSSYKYILLEFDLNFLVLVLKEYIWTRNSSSSVDTETKTYLYQKTPPPYNARSTFVIKYVLTQWTLHLEKPKCFYSYDGKNIFNYLM